MAQVMIYMYALPLVAGSPWEGKSLDGCLVYRDGTEKHIPPPSTTTSGKSL